MWEKLFHNMLETVLQTGDMQVCYPSGRRERYGDGTGAPVELTFHDCSALSAILRNPELGLGETYMNGTMTIADDDLRGFMTTVMINVGQNNNTGWQRLFAVFPSCSG